MRDMSHDEYIRFLLDTPRTAKVATVTADGRPHIKPVWFTLDGDVVIFTTYHDTVKAKHIQRDSRISICVDDDKPPFTYVIIDGHAEIASPTPEELLYWSTQLAGRYMGADKAEAYGKRNGVPGELLIRVTPVKVLARTDISD